MQKLCAQPAMLRTCIDNQEKTLSRRKTPAAAGYCTCMKWYLAQHGTTLHSHARFKGQAPTPTPPRSGPCVEAFSTAQLTCLGQHSHSPQQKAQPVQISSPPQHAQLAALHNTRTNSHRSRCQAIELHITTCREAAESTSLQDTPLALSAPQLILIPADHPT
jgi:hypothetical protein